MWYMPLEWVYWIECQLIYRHNVNKQDTERIVRLQFTEVCTGDYEHRVTELVLSRL